jgi:phosphatidylethanolamine/phosphatidyl-N-methylethanolamine N-methyltransferase
MRHDLKLFLREMLRKPGEVVALAPSSDLLADAMTRDIGPATGRVAELGGGTGAFTRAILARGVAAADLAVFELNADFVAHLRASFPGVSVRHAGAETIARHCPPGLGAVISGLPLLSMPRALQRAILGGAFAVLRPGGIFVQFTYGPRPPLPETLQTELGLAVRRGRKVWGNLPPARIYTYVRGMQ